jgi:hypothetical protein
MPAIQDRAVIEAKGAVVQVIAQLLRSLLEGIANLDRKIEEAALVLTARRGASVCKSGRRPPLRSARDRRQLDSQPARNS